ncbi:hypothetical protein ST47_g3462 [Ascochyta rabiei]|uniref:Uncharacterized protein n=1 Tax=Didymella rabiei TaxID=5454 RepID=A0A163HPM6_DIDRA|nr:hypothetical protein ST47_g3462 [Ascochyta rabiei]
MPPHALQSISRSAAQVELVSAANHSARVFVIASRSTLRLSRASNLRQVHSRTDLREAGLFKHLDFVMSSWVAPTRGPPTCNALSQLPKTHLVLTG